LLLVVLLVVVVSSSCYEQQATRSPQLLLKIMKLLKTPGLFRQTRLFPSGKEKIHDLKLI
jgi:hypothetical protein